MSSYFILRPRAAIIITPPSSAGKPYGLLLAITQPA
jgi:hypothetical protein